MKIKSNIVEVHIFRKTGDDIEFLLLKRAENENYPGIWQMVTGSINENEEAYKTALREVNEETGITPIKMWVVPNVNSFYSANDDSLNLIPVFALEAESNSNVIISHEHIEFKWVDTQEAKSLLAWDGQRKSVELIVQYFNNEQEFFKLTEIFF